MPDRPTALELLEAVTEFLAAEVLPTVTDPRLRFRTLVALNALGIAYRELDRPSNTVLLDREQLADLARRIRSGDPPDDVLATLKAHVAAKLEISNPSYLDKYR
jgi:Domain of unknown function (DUF6285)